MQRLRVSQASDNDPTLILSPAEDRTRPIPIDIITTATTKPHDPAETLTDIQTQTPFDDKTDLLPEVLLEEARSKKRASRYRDAVSALRRALTLDPGLSPAYELLAEIYETNGLDEVALTVLASLLRSHLFNGRYNAAERVRRRMQRIAPGHLLTTSAGLPAPIPLDELFPRVRFGDAASNDAFSITSEHTELPELTIPEQRALSATPTLLDPLRPEDLLI